jgi:hypothetical protein
MAATRRGCVHPIFPREVYPASARYCVIWVVFPDPVSPITTNTCREHELHFDIPLLCRALTCLAEQMQAEKMQADQMQAAH